MITFIGFPSPFCNFFFFFFLFFFFFGGIKDIVHFSLSMDAHAVGESFSDFTMFVRQNMLWSLTWVQMNFNFEKLSCFFCDY